MALQVWLPLNGDLHNQGLNQNVTATNHGAVVNDSGKIGKCYYFNGESSYMTLNNSNFLQGLSQFSIAFWCNPITSIACLFQIKSSQKTVQFGIWNDGNGFSFRDSKHSNLTEVSFESAIANNWNHFAFIYNSGSWTVYKNGIRSGNGFTYNNSATTNSDLSVFNIGRTVTTTSTTYYAGKINDFRIYDHALSAKEVEEIAKGLILHYKLDNNGMGGENLFIGSAYTPADIANFVSNSSTDWTKPLRFYNGSASIHSFVNGIDTITLNSTKNLGIAFVRSATEISLDTNSQYTISCEAQCSSTSKPLCIGLSYYTTDNAWVWRGGTNGQNFSEVNTWQKFTLTFTPDSNTQYICYCFTVATGGNNTLKIRNCKLEKGSVATIWSPAKSELGVMATTVYDSSGYRNNGTIIGNLTAAAGSPRYEMATQFDGNSYILTPSGSFNWWDFEQGTFCAWMNPSATASGWSGSVGIAGDNGYNRKAFSISYYANSFRPVYCNQAYSTITTGKSLPLNEWHFCVATVNGTEIKTYFDGEPVNTTTIDWSTATIPTDLRFQVGVDLPGTDEKFNGKYSDIKFYATALTSAQVKELYQTSMLVDASGNIIPRGLEEV